MTNLCPSCSLPIDKHEAGRELDLCVESQVIGRQLKWGADLSKLGGSEWGYWPGSKKPHKILPYYSTSFAAYEVLIEEMVRMSASGFYMYTEEGGWRAGIYRTPSLFAPTLPHAISLAYLAYAGQKGGE